MSTKAIIHAAKETVHRLLVVVGALGFTLAFFLVLPLMQAISKPPDADTIVQSIDTANVPPPPPPPQEEEKKKEPDPPKEPPKLAEELPPLDLSQLELALNPGMGDGLAGGDFAVKLSLLTADKGGGGEDVDALFSMADLDRVPRVIYQPGPVLSDKLRQKAPGTVYIVFMVDLNGKVENPIVQKSSDTVFDAPALAAVKQWRFEPGSRNGSPVRFRMRVPITFPKGQ